MPDETVREQHHVSGEKLLQTVKRLIHEGNARRITVKDANGRAFLEIPLTVGVVGAFAVPVLVAIGAIAALAADYTLDVERVADPKASEPKAEPVGSA